MTAVDRLADLTVTASVTVAAPPRQVWSVVADLDRIGEFSPECHHIRWLGGAVGPAVGARFAGTNVVVDPDTGERDEWTLDCAVTALDPPALLRYTVGDRIDATPASEWTYAVAPVGFGSLLTETFRHLPGGRTGLRRLLEAEPDRAVEHLAFHRARLRRGIELTLSRMRAAAERTS